MIRSSLHVVVFIGLLIATGCARVPNVAVGPMQYRIASAQFERTLGASLGPCVLEGNQVTTLVNGKGIFPAMLQAIREAKETICLETFIYWRGAIAKDFADALSERARHGVAVHVIIDAVGGARMDRKLLRGMKRAGVQVVLYHPLHWFRPLKDLDFDHRTHRKLLIVDGRIGFTGGVGIGEEWTGDAEQPPYRRENHYRIEGPVVAELQAVFVETWMEYRHEVLHGEKYFPELEYKGGMKGQFFASSPQKDHALTMRLFYALSVAGARHSIQIATAYFVPDDDTEALLLDARRRGVRVQIIGPGPFVDYEIARKASKAEWGDLLKAGVEIYEYQPTVYHCKQMIVDDLFVSIGSSNFDNRSFAVNEEANLNIIDAGFAREQRRLFEADLKQSKRITYEEWRRRPYRERFLELFAVMFAREL